MIEVRFDCGVGCGEKLTADTGALSKLTYRGDDNPRSYLDARYRVIGEAVHRAQIAHLLKCALVPALAPTPSPAGASATTNP